MKIENCELKINLIYVFSFIPQMLRVRLAVMGDAVSVGEIIQIIVFNGRDGCKDGIKAGASYRPRRKSGVAVCVVRRVGQEVFRRKLECAFPERVQECGVNLQKHAFLQAVPKDAGNHSPVFRCARLPLQKRCHNDHIFEGFTESIYFVLYGCDVRIKILAHRADDKLFGRVREEEIRVRKEISFYPLCLREKCINIKSQKLVSEDVCHVFCPRPFRNANTRRLQPVCADNNGAGDAEEVARFLKKIISRVDVPLMPGEYDKPPQSRSAPHNAVLFKRHAGVRERCPALYGNERVQRKIIGRTYDIQVQDSNKTAGKYEYENGSAVRMFPPPDRKSTRLNS